MTIKPIDLQTNMGQVHEIAREQHAQMGALAEQMHHLDKEANDKSRKADTLLEETRKAEHTSIRLDDHKEEEQTLPRKKGKRFLPKKAKAEKGKVVEFVENGNLGNIIDIRK
ncbi:MAG: hypothetical protein ACRCUT_00345 [Spirochaetota bacterium]